EGEQLPPCAVAVPAESADGEGGRPALGTPSTAAAFSQERPGAEVASDPDAACSKTACSLGSTCSHDLDLSSADGEQSATLLTPKVDEQRAALLEEDRALFDLDARRREAARAAVPHLRRRADGLLAGVAAEACADAVHFCSDDTLTRYLMTSEGNVEKAASMLKASLEWRASFFEGIDMAFARSSGSAPPRTLCPCCQSDPRQHSFFRIGSDAAGRDVIYSCAGRALNKNCEDGMKHMALELERMFRGSSSPGQ
ncbi:unnamed protein product, partial [Prorocentrum cordatum]